MTTVQLWCTDARSLWTLTRSDAWHYRLSLSGDSERSTPFHYAQSFLRPLPEHNVARECRRAIEKLKI